MKNNTEKKESLTDILEQIDLLLGKENLTENIRDTEDLKKYNLINNLTNKENLNPIYTTDTDSDKSVVIDKVLADSGLPDVTDHTDFVAVANKAKRDSRINTANFDLFTAEQIITKSCEQLNITTQNRSITNQSRELLTNMNQHDRDTIAGQLDLNESSDTLT